MPPLSEVPGGDWYCVSCEQIVRAQYDINVTSSGDEAEYVPNLESFELDLSSDVDITGSSSSSSSSRAMSLDLESESDFSNTTDGTSPGNLSEDSEDSIIDIVGGVYSNRLSPVPSNSCSDSDVILLPDSFNKLEEEVIEIIDSDSDSDVFSKKRSQVHSNKDLSSFSSDASGMLRVGESTTEKRKQKRSVFSEDSVSEDEVTIIDDWPPTANSPTSPEKSVKSGVAEVPEAKPTNTSKQRALNDHHFPSNSSTIQPSASEHLDSVAAPPSLQLNHHASEKRFPSIRETDCNDQCLLHGESSATPTAEEGANRNEHQRIPIQKWNRGKRRRKRKIVSTNKANSTSGRRTPSSVKRKRRRRRKRRKICWNVSPIAALGSVGPRSRARTAATHTPMPNAMRAAVRESLKHDNQMEGLEWARTILAKAANICTPRRSNFFQNFPTLEQLPPPQSHVKEDLHAVSRMYGFTPSRNYHLLPSLVSTPRPTPTASPHRKYPPIPTPSSPVTTTSNDEETDLMKEERKSAEIKRRLSTRRRALSRVLVTPVKLGGKKRRAKAPECVSSSSECASSDLLGEMCRGLDVLESKGSMVERDGTLVPKDGGKLLLVVIVRGGWSRFSIMVRSMIGM